MTQRKNPAGLNDWPVLSIRQPWIEFILQGWKKIEWRSWSTTYRGPLYLHAARRNASTRDSLVREFLEERGAHLARGCIVGRCVLADCVPHGTAYMFLLRNVRRMAPVPLSGFPRLFRLPRHLLR